MGWTSKACLFWHTSIIPLVDSRAAIGRLQIRIVSSRPRVSSFDLRSGHLKFCTITEKRLADWETIKYYVSLCMRSILRAQTHRHEACCASTMNTACCLGLSDRWWISVRCVFPAEAPITWGTVMCVLAAFSSSVSNAPLFLRSKVRVWRQILGPRVPASQRRA